VATAPSALRVVWWLWLVPAVFALVMPVEYLVAVCIRGLDDVRSTGIARGEMGLIYATGIFAVFSFPPLLVLSPLYIFMFWRQKEQGVALSRRFWVPVYGTALLVVVWAALVLPVLAKH